MKKKTILFLLGSSLSATAVMLVAFAENRNISNISLYTSRGVNNDYEIDLGNQKISNQPSSYSEEISSNIKTGLNNSLELKASNVIKYDDGWQTILPNGYFYNPVDNSTNHNKISGLSSIEYTSSSSSSLSLYYGFSLDNTHINYSHEVTLTSGTSYNFSEEKPNYFYIKNNGNSNVNINDISISYTCADSGYSKQTLNVLMIGNSFSDDTLFYANRVAASYGITLNIYDAYIASCTINTHYTKLNNGAADYSMRRINNGSWDYNDSMSLGDIINSHTWDVITLQQASAEIGRSSSYSNLYNLVNAVRSLVGSKPKFYWYQTWAYDNDYHDYYDYFSYFGNDQDVMFDAIIDCYESEVASLGVFDKLIPAGTAVQNLRTSYMKDSFSRDGKHMSSVHGRYLLALNMVSNLFDIDLEMSPCSYKPTEASDSFKNLAYEAIRNAYKKPLEVTNSIYTSMDLGSYNLNNYTEIDAELVGCSYWNSTDSSNYNKRISNVSGSSNIYTSTKRFTSSTLPVGSLVVVGESFGVRPEAWISDGAQSTRPSETYQKVIEITSSFWSGYAYRAFNIFKAGKTELKGQYDQIFDGFHIYVPTSSLGDIKPKGDNSDYYASDKLTMKNNSLLNIDAFERIHLDPITGFYKCDSYYELTNSYVDDTAKKFMCSRPFYSANGDLPENTVIIVDSGYQWRSDCWGDHGTYSPRPNNVSSTVTVLNSSFWSGFRRRTFNVSSTSNSYVNQNYISFFNHMRIYKCIDEEHMYLEQEDALTMTVIGYATLSSMAASVYGKQNVPVQVTLSGDDTSHVVVKADGSSMTTQGYSYNKNTGSLTINTSGTIGSSSYTLGTITGTVNKNNETISNMSISGSISNYVTNNGSITLSSVWHDRCNYSTDSASQQVWQRRYMQNGNWQYNSGTGQWTTANNSYRMEEDYSMGLRIANNSYDKTSFMLKNDLGSGSGVSAKGFSLWIFNPVGDIFDEFRFYVYKGASSTSGGHIVPYSPATQVVSRSSISSVGWVNIQSGFDGAPITIYNFSLYFDLKSNISTTYYLYLAHISIY